MRRKLSDFLTNLFVPIFILGIIGSVLSAIVMLVSVLGLFIEDALCGW